MTEGEAVVRFEEAGLRDHGARVALPAGGDETCHGNVINNKAVQGMVVLSSIKHRVHEARACQ